MLKSCFYKDILPILIQTLVALSEIVSRIKRVTIPSGINHSLKSFIQLWLNMVSIPLSKSFLFRMVVRLLYKECWFEFIPKLFLQCEGYIMFILFEDMFFISFITHIYIYNISVLAGTLQYRMCLACVSIIQHCKNSFGINMNYLSI